MVLVAWSMKIKSHGFFFLEHDYYQIFFIVFHIFPPILLSTIRYFIFVLSLYFKQCKFVCAKRISGYVFYGESTA